MKLIFNDATDMPIQSYEKIGGAVRFLTIGIAPEKLKEIFEDATKTKVMNVTERGQIIDTLENYTGYDHTEIYPGGIYGVVNNEVGKSIEERLASAEIDIEGLKENSGGVPETYASVFAMAKMSAEKITDDEQALKVADLYDLWSGDGVASIFCTKISCTRYSKTIHPKQTGRRRQHRAYMLRYLQIQPEKCCRGSSHRVPTLTRREIESRTMVRRGNLL